MMFSALSMNNMYYLLTNTCYVHYIDLESRDKTDPESVHIINIDIQDNQEEATIGAFMICDLCTLVRTIKLHEIIMFVAAKFPCLWVY